jgi:putative membrane protein
MYPHHYQPMIEHGFNPVLHLLFWAAIITLVVWALHLRRRHTLPTIPKNSALDILNERYAKSEITKEEYEQKKKDILGS